MKSIGFRSSIVNLVEGASLIISNGDLLSQHLVNWSMGHNERRLSLTVNVIYGNNLHLVAETIGKILSENKNIMTVPGYTVSPKSFQPNFIEIEVMFWVSNSTNYIALRGHIISEIEQALLQQDISLSPIQ